MSNENEDRIQELDKLQRVESPPLELENRVIAALQERQLIRNPSKRGLRWFSTAAAAVVILAIGFTAGRFWNGAQPVQYTHILLLQENRSFQSGHENRVQEYSNWARELAANGTPITGEKLADDSHLLKASKSETQTARDQQIAGFFLIRAKSEEDALQISRTCPHLRYGGMIELRRIE